MTEQPMPVEEQKIFFERMLQKLQLEVGQKAVQIAELSTRLEIDRGHIKTLQEQNKELKELVEALKDQIKESEQPVNELNDW